MHDLEVVDIAEYPPELQKLIDDVRRTDEPRILRMGDEDVAILTPVRKRNRRGRQRTQEDHEAFLSSAGSWEGVVDTDKLLADIRESRERSFRPRVDL
jgi:hypothetical protein